MPDMRRPYPRPAAPCNSAGRCSPKTGSKPGRRSVKTAPSGPFAAVQSPPCGQRRRALVRAGGGTAQGVHPQSGMPARYRVL
jgi:hypothetical protein